MPTAHTLNDRILAHSSNAAHGMEVPPATLLIGDRFPRPGVEIEIETIAAKAD